MSRYAVGAFACLAVVVATISASPAWRDVSHVEDTAIVGSNIWEVAISAPEDLSADGTEHGKSHGGGGHHDQGFFTSKSSKGDNGYKSFDSFHKKDGDSYGYEQHSAFGSAKGNEGAAAHQHATKYEEGDDEGHSRKRRQHEYGGHDVGGGGGAEHGGYEHHGVGEHSSDHHGGHHSEYHHSSGGGHHGGGGSHHGGGGGHHGFY